MATSMDTTSTAADRPPLLRFDDLRVGYGRTPLGPSLSTAFRAGELWAIVGPNGCGKTTTLRTALGFLEPVAGRVDWAPGTTRSYVPQRHRVARNAPLRVIDLVGSAVGRGGSYLRPWRTPEERRATLAAMERVEVADLARARFGALSEGQKQRVLIARALASQPDALLLDEPSSAMDRDAERALFALLRALAVDEQKLVIVVTHHLELVAAHATHVLLLYPDHGHEISGPTTMVGRDACCVRRYGHLIAEAAA